VGLWLKVHREVTGAWRSACYDVYRQVSRRKLAQLLTDETTEFAARHRARDLPRRPRRVAATSGVALLVAGGAAGTYLAVAGSLTAMRTPPTPPAPSATPSPSVSATPSPSVSTPSPSRTASKSPKQGQSNVGVAGR
jgi:hypothetical protein